MNNACSVRTVALPVLEQRYQLGPLLGEGGSAQVHWAWDRQLNRAVAVKLFAPGVAGSDLHRQHRELTALTQLTHPGLVELYDSGTDHGQAYLVMRLAQGPSLADRLTASTHSVEAVAAWGDRLADALAYVHAQGITHRDIKPANVLFDEHDHPLLADFGIALFVDVTRITLTGAVIGTAAYMAPEQVRGELVGPPADVYSLGLVLLEALTGHREYPGTSVESACARLHRPTEVPMNLPAGLTDTLRRMTAIQPTERLSSAAAARTLQAAVTELHGDTAIPYATVLTKPTDQHQQPDGTPRWRTRIMFATAISGVALTAGLLGLITIDLAIPGATGIVRPSSPVVGAWLSARPTGPTRSPAPPAVPSGRTAVDLAIPGATGIVRPSSPVVGAWPPVPPVDPNLVPVPATQIHVPPTTAAYQPSVGSNIPHLGTPGRHGRDTISGSSTSSSDVRGHSPSAGHR
jgi:eukaryotic-like serine/threonine-protein kinase